MRIKTLLTLFMVLTLMSCGSASVSDSNASVSSKKRSGDSQKYLAYEHNVRVNLAKEAIEPTFKALVDECNESESYNCTLLDSQINSGNYISASIRMRIKSEGIESMMSIVTKEGEVTTQRTHVEDLAEPIIDSERQKKMLEAYLEDLIHLKETSKGNVEALIKVATEIASTQSKLEALIGEQVYLKQRVDLDLLTINLAIGRQQSFWLPISESLEEFKIDFSEGVSEAITGFAYLLPWLIILVPLFLLLRYIWRKLR